MFVLLDTFHPIRLFLLWGWGGRLIEKRIGSQDRAMLCVYGVLFWKIYI